MKKTTKHLHMFTTMIILILGLVLNFSMPIISQAAEKTGSCGENLNWILSDDILTITGSGDMIDYADGALAPWFGVSGEIQNIVLPDELTSIGDYAFFGCKNLTNITIPSTVNEIGECAFAQCKSLLQVELGSGLEKLGEGAFQECESLPAISFPNSLKEIGANAYYRCFSLSEVTVPDTVTEIGESAFSYCKGLIRATINASVEELPGWTFYGCTALRDVSMSSSIVSAGNYAFLFCENLNGIYTQGGNVETVHALEASIYGKDGAPKEGLIKVQELPEFSVVEIDDGKIYTQINLKQIENIIVAIKKITQYETEDNASRTEIECVVNDTETWKLLSEMAKELNVEDEPLFMKLYVFSDMVESKSLEYFAGSPIILQIVSKTGAIWEIDMSQMDLNSFTGQYILDEMAVVSVPAPEEEITVIETEEAIPENVTGMTKIPQQGETSESLPIFEPYDADRVDGKEPDLETVDSNPDTSNLTDAEGTTYYISNRSSKWGITLKQFSVYVALWIASAVLIVAVIMLTANQRKKSKEQYEELVKQGEAEDAAAEETLQLEIMKEMLNRKE